MSFIGAIKEPLIRNETLEESLMIISTIRTIENNSLREKETDREREKGESLSESSFD